MAKLPSAPDLGPLPIDGSRRPVASAHVSVPDSSAAARGLHSLGVGINKVSDSLDKVLAEQEESEYRNAKSDLIKNALDLDTKYADDPDYTTVRDRYMADFDGHVTGNIATIQNPRIRDRLLREAGEMAARKDNSYSQLALRQGADDAKSKWLAVGQDYLSKSGSYNDDQARDAVERFNLIGDNLAGMRGGPTRVQIQLAKDKFKKQFDDVRFNAKLDGAKQAGDFDAIEAQERGRPTIPETAGGPFDRRRFLPELEQKPWLRERLQTIVQGEGGHDTDPETKQIYLESIFNRAAARGQSLEQVTKEYTGQGSDGYYPRTTLVNGRIRNREQYEGFQPVFDAVLGGSDKSTEALGFPATGNASAGVAQRGVASGRYAKSGNLGGGQTGAPGVETFVQGHGSDDVETLESTRTSLGDGGYGYTESTKAKRLKQIESARRTFQADIARQEALEKRQAQKASDEREDIILRDIYSDSPAIKVRDVAADRILTREAKERMLRFIDKPPGLEPAEGLSNSNTVGLLDRIRKKDGDPNRINTVDPLYDAYLRGNINKADFKFVMDEFKQLRGDGGESLEKDKVEFLNSVKGLLDKSTIIKSDESGKQAFYLFQQDLKGRMSRLREEGKDPRVLLDPDSPQFFGRPENLSRYAPPLQTQIENMKQKAAPSPGGGSRFQEIYGGATRQPPPSPAPTTPGQLADTVMRKPGETVAEWKARTGR